MPLAHVGLAVLVAAIWGLAFTVIRIGLDQVPPLMLTALRFFFAAVPLVFFVRPPKAPIRIVLAYGLIQGAVMFGLLFLAIALGMPAGLASLVVQCQVFFTIILAIVLDGERPKPHQAAGAAIAFLGVAGIAFAKGAGEGAPLGPLLVTLASAFAWGVANIVSRRAASSDPMAFVVWSSLAAPPVLVVLSLVLEPAPLAALMPPDWTIVWVVAVLALPTTVLAFGIWVFLLRRHAAAVVTPFALLIPIFGFGGAAVFLGERWSAGVAAGAVLVFVGRAVNVFGERLFRRKPA